VSVPNDARDGPLPALFLALTAVAGALNAISYLRLDHTFVANMTGNIMFVGFALVGAHGVSLWASLLAVVAFVSGALAGGGLALSFAARRGQLFLVAIATELVAVGIALAIVLLTPSAIAGVPLAVVIAMLSGAMGIQSAVTRRIALADLPTVVLTTIVSAMASGVIAERGDRLRMLRRAGTVGAMLAGATASAALCVYVGTRAALGATFLVLLITTIATLRVSRTSEAWITPA
jgi:uncharacterized membrane protein YoaK (UPF0700 family)